MGRVIKREGMYGGHAALYTMRAKGQRDLGTAERLWVTNLVVINYRLVLYVYSTCSFNLVHSGILHWEVPCSEV